MSERVRGRQAERYADRDAQIAADPSQAHAQDMGYQQQAAPAPATAAGNDTVARLKHLAELKKQGILSDDEFTAKPTVLGT